MHQIHFVCWGSAGGAYSAPDPFLYLWGLLLSGWRETGRGEKVKGKEGERWREGFGPPKNFGVAPPMLSFEYWPYALVINTKYITVAWRCCNKIYYYSEIGF